MKSLRWLLIFLFVLPLLKLQAQDIHFTQFNLSPMTLNPGLTGAFEGTFRIGGIYRDQWRSVIDNQYQTPSFFIDAPIVRGFGKNDWLGVGVSFLNDKAGTSQLSHLEAMLSLAYHLAIGKKANTYLSLGFQGGYVQKKLDQTALIFQDQLLSGGLTTPSSSSMELANFEDTNISYPDFTAGAVFNTYLTSKFNFYAGFAMHHLLQPEDAFLKLAPGYTKDDGKLPSRMIIHGGLNIDIGKKLVLKPMGFYQQQAKASEIGMQLHLGYHLNAEKDITLNFGGGYRLNDAVEAMIGMDIKGLKVGFAYDVNVSDLTAVSNNRGGFEIGAWYIARVYKTPVVKPVLFCPRF